MKLDFDIVVIGAGISGMTAAIYLKRANINTLIIENNAPGGQVNRTNKIENYPGFVSIDGPTLAYTVFSQVQNLNIPYKHGQVIEILDKKEYKIIKTNKEEITCKSVIIATGRKPKELGLPNEKRLIGKGISLCAICDGNFFKNKVVAVVGSDKHAVIEAEYLSEIASKVILITKEKELDEESKRYINNKMDILYESEVIAINEKDNKLNSIDIKNKREDNLIIDGLFVVVGNIPVTNILDDSKVKLSDGYILVDQNMRTNVKGIYACGDVVKKDVYQISNAVGEGAVAALTAINDLKV